MSPDQSFPEVYSVVVEKTKIYSVSQHNPTGGTWSNTISYVPQNGTENLLQKLSPGDFDGDGFTDWDDLNAMIAALAGGSLPGDDTYDFDEDGDSTYDGDLNDDTVEDDVDFFMRNIFDSDYGDFNWNGVIDYGVNPSDGILTDEELLGGWGPGDAPIPLPAGWRGFSGPSTPGLIDFEEWDYLFDIPEPSSLALAAFGLLGSLACGRRRRQ